MPQILVSIRSLSEALSLPLDQIGIVDIKEPTRGSLGSADLSTILGIHAALKEKTTISVALGELRQEEFFALEQLPEVAYAKYGLSQLAGENWQLIWERRVCRLPSGTTPVAVIYADWKSSGSPSPESTLEQLRDLPCGGFLIDTFDKTQGGLFDHLSSVEINEIAVAVRERGAKFVLAGGIHTAEQLELAMELEPDWIGVRGAICVGERTETIGRAQVEKFLNEFSSLAAHREFRLS